MVDALSADSFQEAAIALLAFSYISDFRSEVAAFVVRATLQCIIHILKQCVLYCPIPAEH